MSGQFKIHVFICYLSLVGDCMLDVKNNSSQKIPHKEQSDRLDEFRISCFADNDNDDMLDSWILNRNVTELGKNEFTRYSKLKHLEIRNCPLEDRIHTTAFKNIPLKTLILRDCMVQTIPKAIYNLKNTLKELHLNDIETLKKIPNDTFKGIKSLSYLSLSKIVEVPGAMWNVKDSLSKLDLRYNKMTIELNDFRDLQLTSLSLPNVNASTLPIGILHEVAGTLRSIDISSNNFTDVDWLVSLIQASERLYHIQIGKAVQQVGVLESLAKVACGDPHRPYFYRRMRLSFIGVSINQFLINFFMFPLLTYGTVPIYVSCHS